MRPTMAVRPGTVSGPTVGLALLAAAVAPSMSTEHWQLAAQPPEVFVRADPASALPPSPLPATAPDAPHPAQCADVHNNSCIHNPWGKLAGYPKTGVVNASACCALCRAASECVAWTHYGTTCNVFGSMDSRSKVNAGSCVAGGELPQPPPPPRPPLPPPPGPHLSGNVSLLEAKYDVLLNSSCSVVASAAPLLPTNAVDSFMRLYRNFSGLPCQNETVVVEAAMSLLQRATSRSFLAGLDSFNTTRGIDFSLVRCAILRQATPAGLAQVAAQSAQAERVVANLLADGILMRDVLMAGGARDNKIGEAMIIFNSLLNASKVVSMTPSPLPATAPDAPHPAQCADVHNNSCIHNPWGKLAGYPKTGVVNASACCALCRAASECVAWTHYGTTCNVFGSMDSRSKVNAGSCVAGGELPQPPPIRPHPPPEPSNPWDDRSPQRILRRLALGTALEFAVPFKHMNDDTYVDPVARYLDYEGAYLAGDLDPGFESLTAFECRFVTNSPALDTELAWLRATMSNFRPDQIAHNESDGDPAWRYASVVHTDVQYHDPLFRIASYTDIPAAGGECGPRAWFGRFARRAFGMPVWGVKQQGHAAMSTWSPEGWSTLLGAGWDHVWWDDQSGSDFNLETQSREYRGIFQQVLRAQWAGSALGEPPVDRSWTPRLPGKAYGQGGLWNALALYLKKATIATYGRPPTRRLQKPVVQTKVAQLVHTWSRKRAVEQIVTAKDGSILIPASTAMLSRNAEVLPSFDAGLQLLHTGEWKDHPMDAAFEYHIDVSTTQTMQLLVNFTTWHIDQHLLFEAPNVSNATRAVPVFRTAGWWNLTEPISVKLVAGTNILRFWRNDSRAMAFKNLVLRRVAVDNYGRQEPEPEPELNGDVFMLD